MALLFKVECNKCYKVISEMEDDGYAYFQNGNDRIVLGHPQEADILSHHLGISHEKAEKILFGDDTNPDHKDSRIGFCRHYFCLDCKQKTDLDPNKDNLICSKCQSKNIKEILKMKNSSCPYCQEGQIQIVQTGIS